MSVATGKTGGWIDGEARIVYQHCSACDHVWYFRRGFCPHCGADAPQGKTASGYGTLCALSLVHRAPSEQLRECVPYLVVLVDTDEGFRMMAHGDRSLSIGDRVQASFVEFGGRLIPFFKKA